MGVVLAGAGYGDETGFRDGMTELGLLLAMALPQEAWRTVTWRADTNTVLSSRFAGVRVRPAHRDYLGTEMHGR